MTFKKGYTSWNKGKKASFQHSLNQSKGLKLAHKNKKWGFEKGCSGFTGKHTEETKQRLRELRLKQKEPRLGKRHSEETKDKISRTQKEQFKLGLRIHPLKGKRHSLETKKKMRNSRLKYIELSNGKPAQPTIGKLEKPILDVLEECFYPYTILRQHKVEGYFLDGYCPALNLAIEIDEPAHRYNKNKDNIKQLEIEKELNCKFLRIDIPRGVMYG